MRPSQGNQRRAQLAVAAAAHPEILVVDECRCGMRSARRTARRTYAGAVTGDTADAKPRPSLRHGQDSGDGWVTGPDGTRRWGRFGAAGLVAHDPARGILLQHRATWSDFGDTWGIPGGARHRDEAPVTAALRESYEEANVPAVDLTIRYELLQDLGFWSYTTVIAQVETPFEERMNDAESHRLAWVAVEEVAHLRLHPGFAATWPHILQLLDTDTALIVDVANVMGSRPDGWWRDRAGAAARLVRDLAPLTAAGLPGDLFGLDVERVWPRVTFVLEGKAKDAPLKSQPGPRQRILLAPGSGDDAIVAAVEPGITTVVATSDRGLRERVHARGARTTGPATILKFSNSS